MSLRFTRIITFLWIACIVVGTAARSSQMGEHMRTVGLLHLALHLLVFGVLGTLLVGSFRQHGVRIRILVVVLGVVLGSSAELYEHLAFGNEMEYIDVVTNTLGVLLGFAAGETLPRRTRG